MKSNRHLTCPYYTTVNLSFADASKGPQYTDRSDDCSHNHMDRFVVIEPWDTDTKRVRFHYANSTKEDENENDNQELMGEHGGQNVKEFKYSSLAGFIEGGPDLFAQ